jgi:diadenosine tetraphosphate (Ap4A) HIT family hydrolase
MASMETCSLCHPVNETVLWRDDRCRAILVDDPDYRGFCRVIWLSHVKEMTDLMKSDRAHLMNVVFAVEQTLREQLRPDKINLASLGNQVPHLHWHVIPRFTDDAHFPDPIWAARKRQARPASVDNVALAARLSLQLHETLSGKQTPP